MAVNSNLSFFSSYTHTHTTFILRVDLRARACIHNIVLLDILNVRIVHVNDILR